MDAELILTPGLGNATHLLAVGREAVAVDPPRDAWRVLAAAEANGWRITHVVETHVHNDYLSGALELRDAVGAEIVAPARGGYEFAHRGADEGDVLEVGGLRLTARATPGHTPEHLAWEVAAADAPADAPPLAVCTGGSLMVGSAGRTDLLGPAATDALTADQFRSLRRLAALPDRVRVLPTHGTGSFCATGPAGGDRTSTIGAERRSNPLLRIGDEAAFRAAVAAGSTPFPTYYAAMAPINRAGPPVRGGLPSVERLEPVAARAAILAGAHLVDGRSRRAFGAAHIEGALNIELTDTFASYVGWFVPFGAPLVLVLPGPLPGAAEEAATQLFRIGYERIAGVLADEPEAWAAARFEVRSYPVLRSAEVRALAGRTPMHLLDVRHPHEWHDDGIVPDAIQVPIGDLPERLASLPRDAPIAVMCMSGARASIAASMLDAAGFDVRLVGSGGSPDWIGR